MYDPAQLHPAPDRRRVILPAMQARHPKSRILSADHASRASEFGWPMYKVLYVRQLSSPIFRLFCSHFRLYEVVSLRMCVLPYIYHKILKILLKLTELCETSCSQAFERRMADEIELEVDQEVIVVQAVDGGWWEVINDGAHGWVPRSHLSEKPL